MTETYAHSLDNRPRDEWELLSQHLTAVGDKAAELAGTFGWASAARVAGRLHDIGKCSGQFQSYIRQEKGKPGTGGDHSTAGARVATQLYPGGLGRLLALVIAGHHAGLADAKDLDARLDPGHEVPDYSGWQDHVGPLPDKADVAGSLVVTSRSKGFDGFFLARMIFSCLVDADSLVTEKIVAEGAGQQVERGNHLPIDVLRDRLRVYMANKRVTAEATDVNRLRNEVLDHVMAQSHLPTGLFTLTVPTGGGKTLASLSFALDHAVNHKLSRIIYVIPYTSIIEQTAAVFREALETKHDVLEHHAGFDWEGDRRRLASEADGEGADALAKLRLASENWDVPIVVTTAVQFFESLFASRRRRCRKLHNIAKSVIILDEAQTLPLPLLRPCMAAIDELARNYGTTIVLCTATQPALRKIDGFSDGFDIDESRELAPDPTRLYSILQRVRVEFKRDPIADSVIAARFAEQEQMLCIVNTRSHARALFDAISDMPGAAHLTTLMCPRHRRQVLEEQRRRLCAKLPVRLVATSLIEAGVDISFPEVWRSITGIDSIAQAAGRCNREGLLPMLGVTVVFKPAAVKPPRGIEPLIAATVTTMLRHNDPLMLEAVSQYFGEVYWGRGDAALDNTLIEGQRGIMASISVCQRGFKHLFSSIAEAFQMIEEPMEPVVVPWSSGWNDRDAEDLLQRIAAAERPVIGDLRRLQQYSVGIPHNCRALWLAQGVLRPVHVKLGNSVLRLDDSAHYRCKTGLDIADLSRRDPESNVI